VINVKATRVGASKPGGERVSMELTGSATRLRRGYGAPGMEGKTTRVGASEWSRGDASDIDGQNREVERSFGKSDIEGKAAMGSGE
jgi:hypothetical protein